MRSLASLAGIALGGGVLLVGHRPGLARIRPWLALAAGAAAVVLAGWPT